MDWNDDGRLDIIVGDREGSVNYFSRLSFGDIFLIAERSISVAGEPINVGLNSAPSVVDWNSDGLLDLVVGRMEGIPTGLYLYINEGVIGEPLFNRTDTVFCAGFPIQIYVTYPDFADMNNDGLIDLVLGSSSGRIACYPNYGTPEQPLFNEDEDLKADGEVINYYSYIRPSVCDWNEDGIPDILAADYTGVIHLFLGKPETGVHEDETVNPPVLRLNSPAVERITASVEIWNSAEVSTSLYSIEGRMQRMEYHGMLNSGVHSIDMNISGIPVGAYLFVCQAGNATVSRNLVILN